MDHFTFTESISTPIYEYYPPHGTVRGFVSIPHSGLDIPDEFKPYLSTTLTPNQLNEDVDYEVDQLVDITQLQSEGIAVLVAKIHRVCIDLNRSPDTAVFSWKTNTQGIQLIIEEPTDEIKTKWINEYHNPYFEFMSKVVKNIETIKLGFISLLDLHSMPSKPTAYHLAKNPNQSIERRKDFCISDLKGLSCQRVYIQSWYDTLHDADHSVAINDPYFGGYITQYMDANFRGNALQCEINRDIYMDEINKCLIDDKVKELKPILTNTIQNIFIAFNTPFIVHQQVEADGDEKEHIDSQFAFPF